MNMHDLERKQRAKRCDRNDVESLRDAITGLQSTDDPSLIPLHDELMEIYLCRKRKRGQRRLVGTGNGEGSCDDGEEMKTMTKEITVHLQKAQPMPSDQAVPDLIIEATDLVNTEGMKLDEMRAFYAGQARGLAEAMFNTLPGGLIDAILVEMMRRKVSVFAVAYEKQRTNE